MKKHQNNFFTKGTLFDWNNSVCVKYVFIILKVSNNFCISDHNFS